MNLSFFFFLRVCTLFSGTFCILHFYQGIFRYFLLSSFMKLIHLFIILTYLISSFWCQSFGRWIFCPMLSLYRIRTFAQRSGNGWDSRIWEGYLFHLSFGNKNMKKNYSSNYIKSLCFWGSLQLGQTLVSKLLHYECHIRRLYALTT